MELSVLNRQLENLPKGPRSQRVWDLLVCYYDGSQIPAAKLKTRFSRVSNDA